MKRIQIQHQMKKKTMSKTQNNQNNKDSEEKQLKVSFTSSNIPRDNIKLNEINMNTNQNEYRDNIKLNEVNMNTNGYRDTYTISTNNEFLFNAMRIVDDYEKGTFNELEVKHYIYIIGKCAYSILELCNNIQDNHNWSNKFSKEIELFIRLSITIVEKMGTPKKRNN